MKNNEVKQNESLTSYLKSIISKKDLTTKLFKYYKNSLMSYSEFVQIKVSIYNDTLSDYQFISLLNLK